MSFQIMIIFSLLIFILFYPEVNGNQDAKRLYDDLFKSYNILVRPVENSSDFITVKLGLKLVKIIELNLKSQYLMTNMWIKHEWTDHNLKWNPTDYGDLKQLYIPANKLWLPEISLYNNADGAYEVSTKTKVIIHYDGTVVWKSPVTLKSICSIDLLYFPLDEQMCTMRFGSLTGSMINLKHHFRSAAIDLSDYYLNTEYDVMSVTALERKQMYSCCNGAYSDLFFTIRLRRKTLFYTFSLLIPCFSLSFISVFVFYLPTNSKEKVSLAISILISLTFLFLLFFDIMPSTSHCLPLLGKYLIFVLVLVSSSFVITCFILNVHFRSPSTHIMSPFIRKFFLRTLPPYLLINLPKPESTNQNKTIFNSFKTDPNKDEDNTTNLPFTSSATEGYIYPPEVNRAIRNTLFIAYHLNNENSYETCKEDWQIMALVLDRIFFYLFFIICLIGTAGIFLQAPTLYETSFPIDVQQSMIGKSEHHLESILHNF